MIVQALLFNVLVQACQHSQKGLRLKIMTIWNIDCKSWERCWKSCNIIFIDSLEKLKYLFENFSNIFGHFTPETSFPGMCLFFLHFGYFESTACIFFCQLTLRFSEPSESVSPHPCKNRRLPQRLHVMATANIGIGIFFRNDFGLCYTK